MHVFFALVLLFVAGFLIFLGAKTHYPPLLIFGGLTLLACVIIARNGNRGK
jgi:hypothetical protein